MIQEVTQEELVKTFEKYMKMKQRNLEANQRYSMTEKGKEKKKQILKKYIESKKDDIEYRVNRNNKQRERYKIKVEKANEERQNKLLQIEPLDII